MARARLRRKGRRTVVRWLAYLVIAGTIAAPLAFLVGMLVTPMLWRAEGVLGIELAGHSGPSDWIFWLLYSVFTVLGAVGCRRVHRGWATLADHEPDDVNDASAP